ncbi:hypothetical protein C7293_16175 [filamentous cyanobacterium CCT1]|nr:hypothetical protein C7293_16175 [filamentous cyanobacterium CCT1]PSN77836.1 hypothetical protein C8B47_20000 [filamentous cyanobacterium CCP4]
MAEHALIWPGAQGAAVHPCGRMGETAGQSKATPYGYQNNGGKNSQPLGLQATAGPGSAAALYSPAGAVEPEFAES